MRKPSVRFRVDFGAEQAVGPGKIALLEQIAESGSLAQAARNLKMSYRRAWLLMEDLRLCFEEPVVDACKGGLRGGGSVLTPFGTKLVSAFRAFETEVQRSAARHFHAVSAKARAAPGRERRVRGVPVTKRRSRSES